MIGFSLGGCISAYVASLKSIRPEGLIIVNGVFGVKNVFNKLLPGVMTRWRNIVQTLGCGALNPHFVLTQPFGKTKAATTLAMVDNYMD